MYGFSQTRSENLFLIATQMLNAGLDGVFNSIIWQTISGSCILTERDLKVMAENAN